MYLSETLEDLLIDFQPDPAHINTNLAGSYFYFCRSYICCSASICISGISVIINCTGKSHL